MQSLLTHKNLSKLSLLFVSIALTIGYWNISVFLTPCLLIIGLWLLKSRNSHKPVQLEITVLLLLILAGYEFVNYLNSAYRPNSLRFFWDVITVIGVIFVLTRDLKHKNYISFVFFIIAFLFTFVNLSFFFFKFFEASYYGFNDFSQFRFLYTPLGFVSNEWVTLLFCFLPFSISFVLITFKESNLGEYAFLKRSTPFRIIGILGIGLVLFNLFISFSRGGYLAFVVFQLLLTLLFVIYKIVPIKRIIIANMLLVGLFLTLCFFFHPTIKSTLGQSLSHKRSTEGRIDQWSSTKEIMKDYPFWGVGAKNYTLVNGMYKQNQIETSFSGRVNNSYIQIATEKGITGLVIYFLLFLIFFYFSYKKIQEAEDNTDKVIAIVMSVAVVAILVREMFFSSIFYNNGILLLMFVFLLFNSEFSVKVSIPSQFKYPIIIFVFSLFTCIIFYYLKNLKAEKSYSDFVESFNSGQFDKALHFINKAQKESDNNALYKSCVGLTLERKMTARIKFDSINPVELTNADSELLDNSINKYKATCKLNPYDALFFNNLGWLYIMENKPDSALKYVSRAISIDPNIALYHVGKGLIIENKDIDAAFDEYKKALLLSPDILDSKFHNQLEKKYPERVKVLTNNVYRDLQLLLKAKDSPIIKARIGKIMMEMNKIDSAYSIFTEVTTELPNLNRPWYYLGLIYEKRGKTKEMLACYQKSIYLDFRDYLPRYSLAKYYDSIKDFKNAQYYHRTTKIYCQKLSEHSSRSKRVYYQEAVKSDIIPYGFNEYIIPDTTVIEAKYNRY